MVINSKKSYLILWLFYLLVCIGTIYEYNEENDLNIQINGFKRNILQEDKTTCVLTNAQIQNYYNEDTKTWLINEEDLSNDLNYDIQSIVDCANDRDYIMFDTENTIIPNDTISISRDLVFSYYTDKVDYENGAFPEIDRRASFTCPEDKAIFNIKSSSVTFANINILECNLTKKAATSPIVFSNICSDDKYSNDGTIKFHHVEFKKNVNYNKSGCFSANLIICSSLEIINVKFEENESGGYVIGNLLPIATLNDVTMNNNAFLRGKMFNLPATLMTSDNNEELIINNLTAYNNIGLILAIENGIASIKNSSFEDNTGSLMFPVLPACITGTNSEITIRSSTFYRAMPIFVDVVESSLEINECLFENLNENGLKVGNYSGITARESELVVENSNFYYNRGYDTAGALKADHSNVTIDGSIFFANTGQRGGALFVECQLEICEVNITNSYFVANTGYYLGGAIRLLSDYEAYISNTTFYQNFAQKLGGALATKNYLINTITISESTFMYNTANDSFGGAIYLSGGPEGTSIGKVNNCLIQNNNSTENDGAGICGWYASIEINGGTISNNTAGINGGGIMGIGSEIILNDVNITENKAVQSNGGGIYFEYYNRKNNLTIINSSINQNMCGKNGGAIMCSDGCDINITNSEISYNQASSYGGCMLCMAGYEICNVNIDNTKSLSNIAGLRGGCLSMFDGFNLNVIDSEISDNIANNYGGAIYLQDNSLRSNFTIFGSTINRNVGVIRASAIMVLYYVDGTISNSTFKNNTCNASPSGIIQTSTTEWMKNQTLSDLGYYTPYIRLMEARENAGITFLNTDELLVPSTTFILENNEFSGNRADFGDSSVMSITDGCLLVNKNCSFTDNYSLTGSNIKVMEGEFYCEDCVFKNNECESSASVIDFFSELVGANPNSTSYLKNCMFSDNNSKMGEGTISVSNSISIMENNTFSNNIATKGAAMALRHANVTINYLNFSYNIASLRGGALYIEESENITIQNSIFEFNALTVEESRGGAIYGIAEQSFTNAIFINCSFISNFADSLGGAIYLDGYFKILVSDSLFRNNTVNYYRGEGGGFVAIGRNWKTNKKYKEANIVYSDKTRPDIQKKYGIDGISRDNAHPSHELMFSNVVFEENHSDKYITGALHLENGVIADLNNCTFFKNYGDNDGAIHVHNSEIYFNKCNFTENQSNNTAGAIRLSSDFSGNLTEMCFAVFKDSIFASNTAKLGGVIALDNKDTALYILENNRFINNSAINGGVIIVIDRGYIYCYGSSFISNVAVEKGGVIDIYIEKNEGMKYYIQNCSFFQNKANIGGVFHLYENLGIYEYCSDSEINCLDQISFYLNNSTISENSAEMAGGGIMISNPYIIYIECEYKREVNFEINGGFEDMKIDRDSNNSFLNVEMCENWKNNMVDENGYGATNATYARKLELVRENTVFSHAIFSDPIETASITIFNVTGLKSGQNLPLLKLYTLDGFNSGPAYMSGENLNVLMSSPDDLFYGTFTYDMDLGIASISAIKVSGKYGTRNITLNSSLEYFNDILLQVELRECILGETYIEQITYCNTCDNSSYNILNPLDGKCYACPENAACKGNSIQPNNGYWHISPCSKYIYKCIADDACINHNRKSDIYNYFGNIKSCSFNESDYIFYEELQCREGYKGPLCGSCQNEYGRVASFGCSKCPKIGYIYLFYIFAGCWFLILTAIGIYGNLDSKPEDFQSKKAFVIKKTKEILKQELENEEENLQEEIEEEKAKSLNREIVEEMETRIITRENSSLKKEEHEIYNQKRCKSCQRIVTETIKVFINYFQVTAIAIAINVKWTEALKKFFSAIDFFGGISGAATIISLDCLLNNNYSLEKSIVRIIISTIWPLFILTLVISFWIFNAIIKKKSLEYLKRRSILTCVVTAYISYIIVTKSLVRVLYCNNVHDSKDINSLDKLRVLWLEDTAIECYTGNHQGLVIFAITFLTLFSFGFPFSIFIYLLVKKASNDLDKKKVYETIGFLYRAYKYELVFWDSVIMFRKGLLASIVVFSYPLGVNLQGLISILVLIIAQSLNMMLMPFKEEYEILNKCESISLFVSTFTFTGGLFLNYDEIGYELRILIAVLIISLNLLLIILFLIIIIYNGYMSLKIKLITIEKVNPEDNWFHTTKKGVKYCYWSIKAKVINMISRFQNSTVYLKLCNQCHPKKSNQNANESDFV